MDFSGLAKPRDAANDTESGTSLKRENVSRSRRDDPKMRTKPEQPGKQKHLWINQFLNNGFYKRDHKEHEAGIHGEPGGDSLGSEIKECEHCTGPDSFDAEDGSEIGEHDVSPNRQVTPRPMVRWDGCDLTKPPFLTSDYGLVRRISSPTTASSGDELGVEREPVLVSYRNGSGLSRLDGGTRSSHSSGSLPLYRGESGSANQRTSSMQAEANRTKSRIRMSAKDVIRRELLEERQAPPELHPAQSSSLPSKDGIYE